MYKERVCLCLFLSAIFLISIALLPVEINAETKMIPNVWGPAYYACPSCGQITYLIGESVHLTLYYDQTHGGGIFDEETVFVKSSGNYDVVFLDGNYNHNYYDRVVIECLDQTVYDGYYNGNFYYEIVFPKYCNSFNPPLPPPIDPPNN